MGLTPDTPEAIIAALATTEPLLKAYRHKPRDLPSDRSELDADGMLLYSECILCGARWRVPDRGLPWDDPQKHDVPACAWARARLLLDGRPLMASGPLPSPPPRDKFAILSHPREAEKVQAQLTERLPR